MRVMNVNSKLGKRKMCISNAYEPLTVQSSPVAIVQNRTRGTTFSQLLDKIDVGDVESITLYPGSTFVEFTEKDGSPGTSNVLVDQNLVNDLRMHDVDIVIKQPKEAGVFESLLTGLAPFLITFGFLSFLMSRSADGSGGVSGGPGRLFGGSNYDLQTVEDTGVSFSDVAGIDAEKNELVELVDFLKNPSKYTDAGAKAPRGCLLSGPPGTGKTLLAKAIAGEADVPFVSCSASQFVELFVGLGASRIRGLFSVARKKAPCIIFIDEIDAIGKQRGGALMAGGANDEREQTLNQLLTEMDGFGDNSGVVIIGATNRPEVIDPALLRPGRFDRKVAVSLPNLDERKDILRVHSENKSLDSNVSLKDVARSTVGFSGADLANLMNEAAITAARGSRKVISKQDVDEAYSKITVGLTSNRNLSDEARKRVAYHEAGHAVVGAMVDGYDTVGKVTIVPRGNAGGFTQFLPDEDTVDTGLVTKSYLEKKIMVALGGKVAEEIVYGVDNVSTGAYGDLQSVTATATQMVRAYGFSPLGSLEIGQSASQSLQAGVDNEVRSIVLRCTTKVENLLQENKKVLDDVANLLSERETIEGIDVLAAIERVQF